MAKKRGRKRKNDLYFGPEQEEAVVKFMSLGKMVTHPGFPDNEKNPLIWEGTEAEEIERNTVYNKSLRDPLNKMIESIIRKYKLYRKGETFEHLHSATLSFLITKAHKFEAKKGKKAYSYYGTICKNHILGLLISDEKKMKQLYSYEDLSSKLEEKDDFQYEMVDTEFTMDKFIGKLIDSVENELEGDSIVGKKKLTDNEQKVGFALIDILTNWEEILDLMNGGAKFNKNSVLETMRRYTNLSTKDIRLGMKRYKMLYDIIKLDGLENGILDKEDSEETEND